MQNTEYKFSINIRDFFVHLDKYDIDETLDQLKAELKRFKKEKRILAPNMQPMIEFTKR